MQVSQRYLQCLLLVVNNCSLSIVTKRAAGDPGRFFVSVFPEARSSRYSTRRNREYASPKVVQGARARHTDVPVRGKEAPLSRGSHDSGQKEIVVPGETLLSPDQPALEMPDALADEGRPHLPRREGRETERAELVAVFTRYAAARDDLLDERPVGYIEDELARPTDAPEAVILI